MRSAAPHILLWVLVALAVCTAAPAAAEGLEARMQIGRERHRVQLLGRRDGMVLFREAGSTSSAVAALKPGDITRVRVRLEYDRDAYARFRRSGNWAAAAAVLARGVAPALPFIDLRNNNIVAPALAAASHFLRAATVRSAASFLLADRQAGEREYRLAQTLLQGVMQAEWSSRADMAAMQAAICLASLGRDDEAAALFATLSLPDPADDEYGLYRLSQATLLVLRGELGPALEQAVDGLAFATKNLDTFPDSLLLAAHCYAGIGEWHRARDVCYEVARLFPGTHWDQAARRQLQIIMNDGHTASEETTAAANVFFGIDEDLNALVTTLLQTAGDAGQTSKENEPQ